MALSVRLVKAPLLLAGLLLLGPAASNARPTLTVWSAFMRTGPGTNFPVIDEIEHDSPIDLLGCAGAWCKITSSGLAGYITADAVSLPRLPTALGPRDVKGPCVIAGQYSYHREAKTAFCRIQTPPAKR